MTGRTWKGAPLPEPGTYVATVDTTCHYPLLGKFDTETYTGRVLWCHLAEDGDRLDVQFDDGQEVRLSDRGGMGAGLDRWRQASAKEIARVENTDTERQDDEREIGPRLPNQLWLLGQDQEWWTKDRQRLRVEDMGARHCANLLRLLERNARRLYTAYSFDPVFSDAPDEVVDELFRADPLEWLEEQPLIRRLRERAGVTA